MENNFFNFNRFLLQLKRDVAIYYKTAIILYSIIAAPFIIKLFVGLLSLKVPAMDVEFQKSIFFKFVPLLVLIFSAFSFRDFRSDLSAQFYLLIPVSQFEKFLSMWVIVFVLNPIAATVAFYVIDFVFVAFTAIFSKYFAIFNFFEIFKHGSLEFSIMKATFLRYFALLTIFFAGSASFKKDAWLKTLLMLWGISTIFVILLLLTAVAYIALLKHFTGIEFYQFGNINPFDPAYLHARFLYVLGIVVFTAIAYFNITEKQV